MKQEIEPSTESRQIVKTAGDLDVEDHVQELIAPAASKFGVVPEHWIHGWDEGFSFCFECAEKKVAELLTAEPAEDYLVDGGWGTEGDSQAFCETCHRALDNSFTECAAEHELDYFEESGFDINSPGDCHSLQEIIYTMGCGDDELNKRIRALCEKVLASSAVLSAVDSQ